MNYILSPCHYAAEGLARIIMHEHKNMKSSRPQLLDDLVFPLTESVERVIVFLPDDPLLHLTTLEKIASLVEQMAKPMPMIILKSCPSRWLWKTLVNLVSHHGLLSEIRVIDSNLPVHCISAQLHSLHSLLDGLLLQQAERDTLIYGNPGAGLSKPELNVILDLLLGYNIIDQANNRGLSPKTLYRHRMSGLKKIAEHHPLLATYFPGNVAIRQSMRNSKLHSP